jgi:DNA-binding CsgD family transcriptional regulator
LLEALRINRAMALQQLKIGAGAQFAYAIADTCGVLYDTTADFAPLLRREWPAFSGSSLPREIVSVLAGNRPTFTGREIAIRHRRHAGLIFLTARPRGNIDSLSNRELGVARLIAAGMSYKEIARSLLLAPATVRNHTQSIHDKLQVRRVAELTRLVLAGDWR